MSRPPKHIALAALLAALGAPAGAQPAVYRLDPAHSFVHFEVMHFGTATLRGRFGPLEGIAELDLAARRRLALHDVVERVGVEGEVAPDL